MRKFLANLLALVMMFSIFAMNNSTAEAKADLYFTTTNVVLESGKITVYGYLENKGDLDCTLTKAKLIVDVKSKKRGTELFSDSLDFNVKDCYVAPGQKRYWKFWYNDKDCPRYSSDDINWTWNSHTWWN